MKTLSIRLRLTLWYGGVLAMTLVAFGLAVYLMLGHALMKRIDNSLHGEYDEIEEQLAAGVAAPKIGHDHGNHHESYLVRVTESTGQVLSQSQGLDNVPLPVPSKLTTSAKPIYETRTIAGAGSHRMLFGRLGDQSNHVLVQVATSLRDYEHELAELKAVLLTIVPVGLIGALAGGYWLAGRALAPVDQMAVTARRISGQNLGERIAVANSRDELGRLAETLNEMISRLQRSFDSIRQFTADASHELLTPLTAIRTETEVALRADRPPEQYRRVLASVLEEVERMSKLADHLLLLSREDSPGGRVAGDPVRIDQLVSDVAGHMRAVADQAELSMAVSDLPVVTVAGDSDRLRQVFFNLLDNAVKYTRPGGSVTVRGRVEGTSAVIEVADTGIGIPAEHLWRIFDRFYRVDKSRSRELGGVGLGLSISKAFVESHGGQLAVESTAGKGSTFIVRLPLRNPDNTLGGDA